MPSNEEKQRIWQAYKDRKPLRVPVTYGVNPRVVLLDPKWNTRGITFQEYFAGAEAAIEVQLAFLEYTSSHLNHYCDNPLGRGKEYAFHVDVQNVYDAAYFGSPIQFRGDQVPDTIPILRGDDRSRIFEMDIDHPLDNPFVRECLKRYEDLKAAAASLRRHSMTFSVREPLMGFDGPLTIATCLRGSEIFLDIHEDREYFRKLLGFIQKGVIIRNRALAELFGKNAFEGPSGCAADDSIQLISNDTYKEMVLPFHREWYALWSKAGPHSIHLCGDTTRHFPVIREELNVMSFDTGFPVKHGPLRKALGRDVEILGGPEVFLLLNGTPQEVYDRTRGILQSGVMEGGRFILREGNNLPPGVPAANLAAMYRCCLEHANYA